MSAWNGMELEPCFDEDVPENVLVWHKHQGVMLANRRKLKENRYYLAWMEIPDRWTNTAERLPDKFDADAYGCVLVKDKDGSMRLNTYRSMLWQSHYTQWQRLPGRPRPYTIRREQ